MNLLSRLTALFGRGRTGKSALRQNMDKALHMKQQAGPKAHIPEHHTAREGMHPAEAPDLGSNRGNEATFTPQRKQTRVARSGDS